MGRDKNDELREEENQSEYHRQEIRDEVFDETGGDASDLGSQDERRHDGEESIGHLEENE